MTTALRFTIVVPTHERRELVLDLLRSLARIEPGCVFEVVVVADGSTDGTAAALHREAWPFPLRVLEQPRSGAAAARNRGAAAARGEILLFLDDDMEADGGLLAAHDRRHRAGARVVLGDMPLHPGSPPGFLAARVGRWAETRRRNLLAAGERIPGGELRTGQLSIERTLFERLGGFDTAFTRRGTFGGEDIELGLRLERAGERIVFEPTAVTRQRYVVGFRAALARQRDIGRAEVLVRRRQGGPPPDAREAGPSWPRRVAGRLLGGLLRPAVLALLERGVGGQRVERLFDRLGRQEYWRGVRAAGGFPASSAVRVLTYHAIRDLAGARLVADYGVPPAILRRQLRWLLRLGARFVTPDEVLRLIRKEGLVPRKALLLTFDDAYVDQHRVALPVLEELGIPAVVFVPTANVGGTNAWDERRGAPSLPICDAGELRELAARGVEIGSHGRHHRMLDRIDAAELADEITGSAQDLQALGLPRPRLLSYPHGCANERVCAAADAAGYAAAFTVQPAAITPDSAAMALPRIEVMRNDGVVGLLLKLARARANRPESRAGDSRLAGVVAALVAAFAAAALLLPRLGARSLASWDEAIYARVAREMLESGSWWVPRLDGAPFLEKPPLYFWFTMLCDRLVGVSELAARLGSALAGVALAGVVGGLGVATAGRRTGIVAPLILVTSAGFVLSGRSGMLDVPLALATWIAVACYRRARDGSAPHIYLAATAIGAAILLKSAAGLLAPLALTLAFALDRQPHARIPPRHLAAAALLAAALIVPWHAAMWMRFGDDFIHSYLGYHLVARALGPLENHAGGAGFYWRVLPTMMGAWTWLLPAAGFAAVRRWRRGDAAARVIAIVALVGMAIVLLVQTRIAWYLLPLLPAFALLIGAAIEDSLRARASWELAALLALGAVAIALAAGNVRLLAACCLAAGLVAARTFGRPAAAAGLVVALAVVSLAPLRAAYGGFRHPVAELAAAVASRDPRGEAPLLIYAGTPPQPVLTEHEPAAAYYAHRPVHNVRATRELLVALGKRSGYVIAAGDQAEALLPERRRTIVARDRGLVAILIEAATTPEP